MAKAKTAILSDIHGNEEALGRVFARLDELGIEHVYHLGDVVGYGQGGRGCLERLQERGILSVQGNHDGNIEKPRDPRMRPEAQDALDREFEKLTPEQVRFLKELPEQRVLEDAFVLVHGALTGRDDYILTNQALRENRELLRNQYQGIKVCFFGHTHLPMVIAGSKPELGFQETRTVEMDPFASYLINPGSVGQPRDKSPLASFAVWDREAHTLTIERVVYDVTAEQTRMREAGLDAKLINRIALGV